MRDKNMYNVNTMTMSIAIQRKITNPSSRVRAIPKLTYTLFQNDHPTSLIMTMSIAMQCQTNNAVRQAGVASLDVACLLC